MEYDQALGMVTGEVSGGHPAHLYVCLMGES